MVKPKILIYDIETSLLMGQLFSLGEQRVNHKQLLKGYFSRTHIITISYKWKGEKKVHTLDWGLSNADEKAMISKFDTVIKEADVVIGKNSDRFDNKHINAQRMFFGLEGMPDWVKATDDLEKQMRKHLNLPSQSLDYISDQLGLGGKNSMSIDDWVALNRYRLIQLTHYLEAMDHSESSPNTLDSVCLVLFNVPLDQVIKEGKAALKKMSIYNKKDVTDTEKVWDYMAPYITPKFNQGTFQNTLQGTSCIRCRQCGIDDVCPNGSSWSGGRQYKNYRCNGCHRYAGRAAMPNIKGALK